MVTEEQFRHLVNILAPPLPKAINGKLREKINAILAPVLYRKLLPKPGHSSGSISEKMNPGQAFWNWLPMLPWEGPPLPRGLFPEWPWLWSTAKKEE